MPIQNSCPEVAVQLAYRRFFSQDLRFNEEGAVDVQLDLSCMLSQIPEAGEPEFDPNLHTGASEATLKNTLDRLDQRKLYLVRTGTVDGPGHFHVLEFIVGSGWLLHSSASRRYQLTNAAGEIVPSKHVESSDNREVYPDEKGVLRLGAEQLLSRRQTWGQKRGNAIFSFYEVTKRRTLALANYIAVCREPGMTEDACIEAAFALIEKADVDTRLLSAVALGCRRQHWHLMERPVLAPIPDKAPPRPSIIAAGAPQKPTVAAPKIFDAVKVGGLESTLRDWVDAKKQGRLSDGFEIDQRLMIEKILSPYLRTESNEHERFRLAQHLVDYLDFCMRVASFEEGASAEFKQGFIRYLAGYHLLSGFGTKQDVGPSKVKQQPQAPCSPPRVKPGVCVNPQRASSVAAMHRILDTYLQDRQQWKKGGAVVAYYYWGIFSCFFNSKSYTQKAQAVRALKSALDGDSTVVFTPDIISTLRNGKLGDMLRGFIKSGQANRIVSSPDAPKQVNTVRDFIQALTQYGVAQAKSIVPNR
ncbi:MAG: hypothetical protein ACOYKA_06040 [Legionellaceae bacterium]